MFLPIFNAVFPSNVPISKKFSPGFKIDFVIPTITSNSKCVSCSALFVGLISFNSNLFQSVKEFISTGTMPNLLDRNYL